MATEYRLTAAGVRDIQKGQDIPESLDNSDWRKYQKWLEKGNTPEPMEERKVVDDPRTGLIESIEDIKDIKAVLKELFGLQED